MGEQQHDRVEGGRRSRLSRRRFLGTGAAGAAALPAMGTLTASAQAADKHGGKGRRDLTVAPKRRGIILYTVRDAISRKDRAEQDPDTGRPLRGGFRGVFETLSRIGYREVEFAGYDQGENGPITPRQLRRLLDDNGLVANGNHGSVPGEINAETIAQFEQDLDTAETLGLAHMGTGGDPTSSSYKEDWDKAADVWNFWGERAAARGIKLYTHNHHDAYGFLLDSGPQDDQGRPTRSSGIRKLEYFFDLADPDYVHFEMDIFWAYVAQFRWVDYTDPDGVSRRSIFDPIDVVQAQPHRFPLFHVKDGASNPESDDGYDMVPAGTGDVPLKRLLDVIEQQGFHHPNYEQDNAGGGDEDPSQSFRFAELSYRNIAKWRD
ncbi:sugar phosphate isomerase/epimerase family protein [Solicola gregarius]|uniref:Sugar phosphate isomerase/epimerase n=1 Tax=Solicola gregarius TaxID=2908642 RepID=A0AA46YL40_9ACTN|nr:TIM barrel protein [Solicola gregarius]UYM06495.1 sugar phosphate isomerase/epimerase [Solicola gregarius]